jgi:hypothetical protein
MIRLHTLKLFTHYLFLISLAALLAACGGGPTTSTGVSVPGSGDGSNGTTTTSPATSGLDFNLQTGDFWEFQWDYYKSSGAQYPTTEYIVLYDGEREITYSGGDKSNEESAPGRDVVQLDANRYLHLQIIKTDPNKIGTFIRNIRIN